MNNSQKYNKLIDQLIDYGYLRDENLIEAFKKFPRFKFVPKSVKNSAHINHPLPIGKKQTISQPLTVAFMLELLEVEDGDKILEIGAGSAWQTAILAKIVGPKGKICAFEILPEIYQLGKTNLKKFSLKNIDLFNKDASLGYPPDAPYDKIISAAAYKKIPKELLKQLKIGGFFVTPTQEDDIRKIIKNKRNAYTEKIFPGFVFVPITKNKNSGSS